MLLNNSELINRKVAFVYAIRDDMFQGHERIKFFDYIIPIIPFINPSNANDKLTELLRESNLENVFSQSFIDDVVTFIDDIDMRLLTNILQEYLVYKESLNHDLKQDNLLAVIIYKNMYPRDFAKLHKNEGDLYDFLTNKASYVEDLILELDNQININQSIIENIEKEKVKNEKELREVYLFNLLRLLDNPAEILIKNKAVAVKDLPEDDNFYALMEEQNIIYNSFTVNRSYGSNFFNKTKKSLEKSFSDIEKAINKANTFNERLDFINKKRLEELKEQNEILKEQKEEIRRWDIKQIFQSQEVNSHLAAFEDSILMRSLLVNGYINENYLDYISLFHEVNITKGDYTFIRKVKSGSGLDFNYRIEKIENVVRKIDESHFEKLTILNHQIVEFILKNKHQNQPKYKSLKKLLKSENKKVIDFIDSYRKSEQTENSILFKELPKIWIGFWDFLANKSKYSEKKVNQYFQLIVANTSLSDIEKLDNFKTFKQHYSNLSNLGGLVGDKNQTENLKSITASFNTKFNDISDLHNKNEVLYDYVLMNENYEINTSNLLAISLDKGASEADFVCANYSTLRSLKDKFPFSYIEKNLEEYIKNVFLDLDNYDESEDVLIMFLNNSELTISLRKLILESTTLAFQNLSEFDDIEIKEEILKRFAIIPSWQNVMDYFNTYTEENLDNILTDYLNNEDVYKALKEGNLSSLSENKQTKEKLALAIIYCDSLSLESHTSLRRCLYYSWTLSSIENLAFDKVESMIDSKFIGLTNNHYKKAKENFDDLHIQLIEKNFSTYIKDYTQYEMDKDDHLQVLESNILNDSQKNQFLNTLSENQIIEDKTIASLATIIYVNEGVSNLNYSFLHGLFKKSSSNEYRIRLFNLNADRIDKSEAKALIGKLGYPYYKLVMPRKQAKINNNKTNLEFTNILKRLGIITSNREKNGIIKAVASR